MLQGKVTYTGLLIALVAALFPDVVTPEEATRAVDDIMAAVSLVAQVVGLGIAWYGRARIRYATYIENPYGD